MGQASYYEMLGVPSTERTAAIRFAYDDLVRRCYPERTPPRGTRFYGELQEAYEVLSRGPLRRRYDAGPAHAVGSGYRSPAQWTLSLLEDFEGSRPSREEVIELIQSNFAASGPGKAGLIHRLALQLLVARDLLADGGRLEIEIPVFHPCAPCHGTGQQATHTCSVCDGTGLDRVEDTVTIVLPRQSPSQAVVTCGLDALGIHNLVLELRVSALS